MGMNDDVTKDRLTAINLALQVKSMREAQQQYFMASGLAKRSKRPDHREIADNWLKQSKIQESLVDASVKMILLPAGEEVEG